MPLSNAEYSALKKKRGLHNWGFLPGDELDLEWDALDLDADTTDTEAVENAAPPSTSHPTAKPPQNKASGGRPWSPA